MGMIWGSLMIILTMMFIWGDKCGMDNQMEFLIQLVILASGFIGIIASIIATSKSEKNKVSTIEKQMQVNHPELRGDHKSLERDHKDIMDRQQELTHELSKVADVANGIQSEIEFQKRERETQERFISLQQIDTNQILETVKTVIEEWKKQNVMIEDYRRQIQSLQNENKKLKDEIRDLKPRTQSHGFKR